MSQCPDSYYDKNEPILDAPIPYVVALVQQEPSMHPYHNMYMKEFQSLHEDNKCLRRDYFELQDSAYEINT